MTADTLTTALATSDMLIINGLHAFDFTLDRQLLIESMVDLQSRTTGGGDL
jgi:hypothetical protein